MRRYRYVNIFFYLLFLICLLFPKSASAANNYYVSTSGNDTNPGTLSQPFKTVQKGVNVLQPGDTLSVREGVYQEVVSIDRSGSANSFIQILAYPGEAPVIDGNNYQLPASEWGVIFAVRGNYIKLSGFEIRYSNWMGVIVSGQHNTVANFNSHHNKENGILITGDNNIVEDSKAWYNCTSNENGSRTRDYWASGLSAARHPNNAIIRRNQVYNNWGEGISSYEATNTLIEDNIIHDNWSVNIYISDTTGTIAQRNFVYRTGSANHTNQEHAIVFGDEQCKPESSDNKVLNNIVWGFIRNIEYWGTANCSTHGLKNVVIANNTLVDAIGSDGNLFISNAGGNVNTVIQNNLIYQSDSKSICFFGSKTGLTLSNNLWSKSCSSGSGSNDIAGDPKFAKTNSMSDPVWFKLLPGSPAIDKGAAISAVTVDFFKNNRPLGSFPDIGAYEYGGLTPIPTIPPATITQINNPTVTPVIKPCTTGIQGCSCATNTQGDANCDGKVCLNDYLEYSKAINGQIIQLDVDFNNDGFIGKKVGLEAGDYEVWLAGNTSSLGSNCGH